MKVTPVELTIKHKVIIVCSSILFVVVVVIFGLLNANEGARKAGNVFRGVTFSASDWKETRDLQVRVKGVPETAADRIDIAASVSFIDVVAYAFRLNLQFKPNGLFAIDEEGDGFIETSMPINMTVGSTVNRFPQGLPMNSIDTTFSFDSGDANNFPFEVYTGHLVITATPNNRSIPISLSLSGSLQSWYHFTGRSQRSKVGSLSDRTITVQSIRDLSVRRENTTLAARVEIRRSFTTKAFTLFIVMTMWALSLGVFALAIIHIISKKKVDPAAPILCAGMLYALPAVRNAQPGAPPIGSTTDVVSFFWAMLIVASSFLMLLYRYIATQCFTPDGRLYRRQTIAFAPPVSQKTDGMDILLSIDSVSEAHSSTTHVGCADRL